MLRVLHLSHTDITTDSRILKEMNSIAQIDNTYQLYGIGVLMDEGVRKTSDSLDLTITSINLVSRKLKYIPKFFRHILEFLELTTKFFFKAVKVKPDVIHCHDTLALPLGVLIKLCANSKLIYDAHELESDRNGLSKKLGKITLFVERKLWRFVNYLVVVSPSIDKWYQSNVGEKQSEIILNSDAFKEGYLNDKFNIADDSKIFIYIGILGQGRGLDLIVDAFMDDRVTSHVVFLGYGEMQKSLKELSSNTWNIHVHDAVSHEQVVTIAKSADVGLCLIQNISLSDYYCLPNKLFEYCFSGIPVLASNFPDISKVVNFYKLGICVDLNVEDVIEGIKRFESDESNVNFSNLNLSELGWEAQEQKLTKFYEKVLSN